MLRNIVWTVVLGGLLAAPAALQAQEMEVQPRTQISISPILALFEIINGEVEYAFSDELSGVFGFGYFNTGTFDADTTHTLLTTDLKLRFYPGATPLEGFAISGILGRSSVTNDSTDVTNAAITLGVELGRNWLFGDAKRWLFGVGIGAKRYFIDESVNFPAVLPTGRLNFGIAF